MKRLLVLAFLLTACDAERPRDQFDPERGVVFPASDAMRLTVQCVREPLHVDGTWLPTSAEIDRLEQKLAVVLAKRLRELPPNGQERSVAAYYRQYGGISVGRVWMRALTWSGVIAGIGGINYVLGYKHYYEDGFASGAGFLGIAVALVGRNHPFGVLLAAFFFATLSQGGLAIHAFVPKQMMDVLQGVVILAVAMAVPEVRGILRGARRRSDA